MQGMWKLLVRNSWSCQVPARRTQTATGNSGFKRMIAGPPQWSSVGSVRPSITVPIGVISSDCAMRSPSCLVVTGSMRSG
ncbi:hypothetical protein ACFWIB_41410 [Streptomyces sp. NPDC127051]|uniref:hypothetical protein n=1 Tax=Streptomyces sp. NPDC127051 TaxID=3347119 RepID=UPI0036582DE4